MSMSNQVSSQVTDAVTQTNTKIHGSAPAASLDNLYMATAQALCNAAHDAVAGQQQNAVLMQAATTQAVMQLLSIDSAAKAAATGQDSSGGPHAPVAAVSAAAVARIKQDVELPNKPGFDHIGPWSQVVRDIMKAEADALLDLQRVSQEAGMAMVKQAATAAVLVQLIKAPDQLESYRKILELIEAL